MKKLREAGKIEMDANGYISLTPEGEEIAGKIYARHKLLQAVLMAIGVDPQTASEEACRIEHDINDDTYNKINEYYNERLKEKQ